MLNGFKDGIVGVTGSDSLFSYCNGNISQATDVMYYNYANMFLDETVISNNFDQNNLRNSIRTIMTYIQMSF